MIALHLPPNITRPAKLAILLWTLVPIRVVAEIVPGLEPLAEHLTGKSVDYLLMVTTLAAVGLTGYVMKLFIGYVMSSKAEQQKRDDEHAKQLQDLHSVTRGDLLNAVNAINNLTDELHRTGKT